MRPSFTCVLTVPIFLDNSPTADFQITGGSSKATAWTEKLLF